MSLAAVTASPMHCSGDMKAGVPMIMPASVIWGSLGNRCTAATSPKSSNLTTSGMQPRSVSITLPGLMIPVHEPAQVRLVQRAAELCEHVDSARRSEWALAFDQVVECEPGQVLHREVEGAVVALPVVVDLHGIRMRERCSRLYFALEAGKRGCVARLLRADQLHGTGPPQEPMLGEIHLPHATLAIRNSAEPTGTSTVLLSTAGRVSRPNSGSYSASKFALAGWTDALSLEERANGVHVGLVLPGFVATEGFPQRELTERRATRWLVSKPERVAEAIVEAGPGGKAERYVPRAYGLAAAARILTPRLVRRVTGSGSPALSPSTDARKPD